MVNAPKEDIERQPPGDGEMLERKLMRVFKDDIPNVKSRAKIIVLRRAQVRILPDTKDCRRPQRSSSYSVESATFL